MKLIMIADTHGKHRNIQTLPMGDVLIHAGDISKVGEQSEVLDFIDWFKSQPHKYKIFIVGNHDRSFDPKFYIRNCNERPDWINELIESINQMDDMFYLENDSVVLDGIKFWGSPWTPWFHGDNWAFNARRGDEIRSIWKNIPMDTNVIITHGPCQYKLDYVSKGDYVGCADLAYYVDMINPNLHICGHIHESYGVSNKNDETPIFVNASCLNQFYEIKNNPVVIDL